MKKPDHFISQVPLTLNDFGNFLRRRLQIRFAPEIRQAVEKARRVIDGILIAKKPVYGVNTGFGNFSEVRISVETVNELQHRLVLSHAAGVGPMILCV
jgi:histidine ammonia-lyase